VACLVDGDCDGGDVCESNQCRQGCAADDDCGGNDVCDTANALCVQCLEDADCAPGTLCTDQRCVLGCRDDRDCADDETCGDDGLCIDACAGDDDCPDNSTCEAGVCVLGCGGDDDRCGFRQVCGADDLCADACNVTDDCDAGFVCSAGACVPGDHPQCESDDDCRFPASRCNDDGVCVGCLEQDDCGNFGFTCLDDQQCHPACNGQGDCFGGQVCADDDSNACVDCNEDGDCGAGEVCAAHGCVASVADDPLCSDCDVADDVCGEGNLCVLRQIADGVRESACGIDCSDDGACPQAFACELVVRAGRAVGAQCVPQSRVVPVQTCVSVRDARADAACVNDDDCGADNVDDGSCVDGVCSLPCSVAEDCFAGEACAPVIGSDLNACQ
jgi:hypothetical protein